MSAAKTGTPWAESCSVSSCSVLVLPVPVAPAMRPCRFIIASGILTLGSWCTVPAALERRAQRDAGIGEAVAGGEHVGKRMGMALYSSYGGLDHDHASMVSQSFPSSTPATRSISSTVLYACGLSRIAPSRRLQMMRSALRRRKASPTSSGARQTMPEPC